MKPICIVILLLFMHTVFAQNGFEESGIIENFTANEDIIETNSEVAENMALMIKNPYNINKVDASILLSIGFLTENQIREIMEYKITYGPLLHILELQTLPSLSEQTFSYLQLCFTVSETNETSKLLKNMFGKDHSMLLLRYGFAPSVVPENWRGTGDRMSIRFQTSIPNKMRFGLSLEKDAGEQIKWDSKKNYYGFDNINFYIDYIPSKRWKQLTIGTQTWQFGQGVLMGAGFYAGKGSETITTLRKSGRALIPIGSTTEYNKRFGISTTYQLTKRLSITGFYSRTKEDARIDTSTYNQGFQSISETGYHRTDSEIEKRKMLLVQTAGYHVRFEKRNFSIGNTSVYRLLSADLQPERTYYNQFYNRGRKFVGSSIDIQWQFKNILLFSEAAVTFTGGKALLIGSMIALHRKVDVSILYRNYGKTYVSPFAQAFGESSTVNNEKGYYIGLKIRPKKEWNIHAYADVFVFPWLKYRVHTPSNGEEYFIKIEYKPNKKTTIYFQHRFEQKYWDITGTFLTVPATKKTTILYFQHTIGFSITLRTRIQWGSYELNGIITTGSLISQDIIYKRRKYQLTLRWMFYDVQDYNARQYAYEPDVPYSFSIPAYTGKAIHPFIIIKYNLVNNIDCWFKVGITKPLNQYGVNDALQSMKSIYTGTWLVRWTF
ncbi:hypothetical protein [uncultured Cytophaga sp.]|uniref:hypothetical protein n=1 Tax=uncultured Cytophaga sp. TaxID=160238 RepID=UPI00262E6E9D|nr:hypothetical protein [uncultured Cytophaga sp.]